MTSTNPARDRRTIALWLLIVAAMIFFMVVLGGTTRLTRSGLSIVEWHLLEGTLPPLSEAHWVELFDKYQQTPEYRKVNVGMDLTGFKEIFWLEYLHRLWGRLIFFAALIPLLWFLWRKRIEKALRASEVRYRRLFESAQDGILILDFFKEATAKGKVKDHDEKQRKKKQEYDDIHSSTVQPTGKYPFTGSCADV